MTTIVMSFSEIMRVGPFSLRALGFPFGVAERAVRPLAWTEAVYGTALRMLRECEADIAASATRPGASRTRPSSRSWAIDANGKCLIEVGPPTIDLLTSDARREGWGHIGLRGAIGLGLIGALCDLAARRGLGILAIHGGSTEAAIPDALARPGWLAALPTGAGIDFFAGAIDHLDRLNLPGDAGAKADIAKAKDMARATAPHSYLGLSAWRPTAGHGIDTALATDISRRLDQAYRLGITADLNDWHHLYVLERRTWAPTSERSRSQAGYGPYRGTPVT